MAANNYVNVFQSDALGDTTWDYFGGVNDWYNDIKTNLPEGTLMWNDYKSQAQELYNGYKTSGDVKPLADFLINTKYTYTGQEGDSKSYMEYFGDPNAKKMNLEKISMADLDFIKGDDKRMLAAGLAPVMIGLDSKRAMDLATGGTFSVNANGQKRFEWSNSVAGELGPVGMAAIGAITMGVAAPALAGALGVSNAAAGALINGGITKLAGGNWADAIKAGGLSYAGSVVGEQVKASMEYGTTPFSAQTNALIAQNQGFGDAAYFSPTASAVGNATEELIRTGKLDPANLVTGNVLAEQGLLTADQAKGFDIAQAINNENYGKLVGLAKDYVSDGSLFDTPEILKEFDRNVIRPAGDALASLDANVLQPIYQPVAETIGDVGRTIDQNLLQPWTQPVGDALAAADKAVRDAVNPLDNWVDDVTLPNINWKGLFSGLVGGMSTLMTPREGAQVAKQDAIQTALQDYKPMTPYRSKLSMQPTGMLNKRGY